MSEAGSISLGILWFDEAMTAQCSNDRNSELKPEIHKTLRWNWIKKKEMRKYRRHIQCFWAAGKQFTHFVRFRLASDAGFGWDFLVVFAPKSDAFQIWPSVFAKQAPDTVVFWLLLVANSKKHWRARAASLNTMPISLPHSLTFGLNRSNRLSSINYKMSETTDVTKTC